MRITCPAGVRLQNFILTTEYRVPTPCACRGNCGKCVVRVVEGHLDVTNADRMWLSEEQLEDGYRLACQAFPKEEIVIEWGL